MSIEKTSVSKVILLRDREYNAHSSSISTELYDSTWQVEDVKSHAIKATIKHFKDFGRANQDVPVQQTLKPANKKSSEINIDKPFDSFLSNTHNVIRLITDNGIEDTATGACKRLLNTRFLMPKYNAVSPQEKTNPRHFINDT